MTTPILYDSQDVGAPQITANNPQSFLNVIKACLVGVSGVAYGSKAPAGWTLPYEDVVNNKMVLRQGGGNQFYLRLGDPGVINQGNTNYGRRFVLVRGYESMSGIDTGTGAFPTVGQNALPNYYWAFATNGDSGNAVTTALPWTLVADDRFFYIITYGSDAYNQGAITAYFYGDIVSNKSDDPFHTVIYANSDTGTTTYNSLTVPTTSSTGAQSPGNNYHWKPFYSSGDPGTTIPNLYIARAFNQIGGSKAIGMHTDLYKASAFWGYGNLAYPDQIDGGIYTSLSYVHENTGGYLIRGSLPGLFIPNHTRPLDHLTTFTGTGDYAGVPFVSLRSCRVGQIYQLDSFNIFLRMDDWRV